VPTDKAEELKALINQLRSVTMGTTGYIAGETLKRVDQPGESLVVTKWQSEFYWNQWLESKERAEIQGKIDELIGSETKYEVYEYD
jgi:heme-degrading monooxygenase HmoA